MQSEDQPYRRPPARLLVQMLRASAWRDDVDDESRLLMEMAADEVEDKCNHNVRLAKRLEQAECGR